ncbi:hypothetical protein RI129_006879 [Pyrocoelia pectoralis]|uniref:Uncharacterized protein n=1 Tax=Pyrocoelia pectoralis TaxID=417401 RepID=A0AAN7VG02_9COLE
MNNLIRLSVFLVLITVLPISECEIKISSHYLSMKLNESLSFYVTVTNFEESDVKVLFLPEYKDRITVDPPFITLNPGNKQYTITVQGVGIGKSLLTAQSSPNVSVDDVFLTATVYRSKGIDVFSVIIGWAYFAV